MSRRLRLALFAIGLGLAIAVINRTGVAGLEDRLAQAGWVLIPVALVYALVYSLNTRAWQITLEPEADPPGYWSLWAMSVTSFALNYITPVVSLGGEAFRAMAVSPWLGSRRAVGSVLQYRLVHSLAHLLFILTALVPAAFLMPGTGAVAVALSLVALVTAGLAWFLLTRQREGAIEAALDLALAIPGIGRLARRLEIHRGRLRELDHQIKTLYHEHPGAFWRALGLEYASRLVMVLELVFVFRVLGLGTRWGDALVATALASAVINLFFFIPFEMGAREAGLFLVFSLLGLRPGYGVFAAVVTRLRELTWIAIGLVVLWVQGYRVRPETSRT